MRVYSSLNRTENLLSASLTLPFHIRYHSPIPRGGYSTVELGAPSLLLHCQNDMQCVQGKRIHAPCRPCGRELCQWVNLAYKTVSESERTILFFTTNKADEVVMSLICVWKVPGSNLPGGQLSWFCTVISHRYWDSDLNYTVTIYVCIFSSSVFTKLVI